MGPALIGDLHFLFQNKPFLLGNIPLLKFKSTSSSWIEPIFGYKLIKGPYLYIIQDQLRKTCIILTFWKGIKAVILDFLSIGHKWQWMPFHVRRVKIFCLARLLCFFWKGRDFLLTDAYCLFPIKHPSTFSIYPRVKIRSYLFPWTRAREVA